MPRAIAPSIAPQAEEGAAYGAAMLAMVGVGAYPSLEAAFRILPQVRDGVQPRVQPIYQPAFERYSYCMKLLKPFIKRAFQSDSLKRDGGQREMVDSLKERWKVTTTAHNTQNFNPIVQNPVENNIPFKR